MKLEWDKLEGKILKDTKTNEDRYEILKKIGVGGAGKVYLAHDILEDRQVAIKTANPDPTMSNAAERFKMEAKILKLLKSPFIIEFYDYIVQDGVQMIVMEYVEGISLDKKLKKEKRITPDEVIKFTKQLLMALEEVHHHRAYHRDIKPDNIHITVEGNIKLLDFGIIQESEDQNLTKQGSVIGTVSYMSPEIIRNPSKNASPRTDIYSVGIMAYELLLGEKPFNADEEMISVQEKNNNLARKIVFETAVPPTEVDPQIPENLSNFVMRLIDKDPNDRYQTTKEALADLKKVISGEEVDSFEGDSSISTKNQIILLSTIAAASIIFFIVAIVLAFTL